ncbi:MAG: cryptochrome/photolyase family protein [Candidatus Comchoanobacterales bacterium]
MTTLYWLRHDLRLHDNPALTQAANTGKVLCIYIYDTSTPTEEQTGQASLCWLHHALKDVNESLNHHLNFFSGNPIEILTKITQDHDIESIFWNRCYTPHSIKRDTLIKEHFQKKNINVQSFNGQLLWEPWQVQKQDGSHYKVFTPFYRKGCLNAVEPRTPLPAPQKINTIHHADSLALDDLALLPQKNWHINMMSHWKPTEQGAHDQLKSFINNGLSHYKEGRNFPSKPYTSRLSPYLHWGQISPNQIWYTIKSWQDDNNVDHFCSELGWREFSYHLLHHYPTMQWQNLQKKFDLFPWQHDRHKLSAWQQGKTGIPMVDAGMRELYQTGFMHNRVRMVVGSFLVKNLQQHWHHGERWFWDCLLDADLANNSAGWQWIAGCGADAAPYFRVFNPVTQGEKFDPDGTYIRQYLPELSQLPTPYLFAPWQAPPLILAQANVVLGKNYPHPIVDLKQSRLDALEALKSTRKDHL